MVLRKVNSTAFAANKINGGYGSVQIIYDIDLVVGKQEIVTIIGPNGCGKSTFLKVAFGLATLYKGNIIYFDEDISGVRTDQLVNKGLSYVPQVNNIFPDLTILENLEMGGYRIKENISDDIERVFQIFPELKERRFELAANLSGGQRQMLALGRALMTRPKMMLLDEPTAALSPIFVQEILDKVTALRDDGMSILLVEQNAKSALRKSDYGYVFAHGELVYEDDADKILNNKNIGELFLGVA